MTRIDRLLGANLDRQWHALDREGKLTVVKKDSRLMRAVKTLGGALLRCDFYAHIRVVSIANAVLLAAQRERDSIHVSKYIQILEKLKNKTQKSALLFNTEERIVESHPEMRLSFDAKEGCFRTFEGKAQEARALERSREEQDALQQLAVLADRILGKESLIMPYSDPRAAAFHALEKQLCRRMPRDRKGNLWVNVQLHWLVKIGLQAHRILPASFGYSVEVPEWRWSQNRAISDQRRAYFINDLMTLQTPINLILEDQKAEVRPDGVAALPNGREIDANLCHQITSSDLIGYKEDDKYNFHFNYTAAIETN